MNPSQKAAAALAAALELFYGQERELAEMQRQNAVLANQLDDALDAVAELRARVAELEMIAARGAA